MLDEIAGWKNYIKKVIRHNEECILLLEKIMQKLEKRGRFDIAVDFQAMIDVHQKSILDWQEAHGSRDLILRTKMPGRIMH